MKVLSRRPSPYRTSFPLEELELARADGTEVKALWKQLSWSALDEQARLAKPKFLYDPEREPAVYASVLGAAPPGPPRCHGSIIDPERDRYWLFLECVEGRELYQVGDRRLWEAAARWLGSMHVALAVDLERHAELGRLLDYDGAHYLRWIERAVAFLRAVRGPGPELVSMERLAERYDEVVDALLEMPRTVIHGEFYASNVLIVGEGPEPRVAAVDWELAAAAPGIVDLAALISGSGWEDADREAMVAAYRSVVGQDAFSSRQLRMARLHLAVQWLGWAPPSWVPPKGQRHDWLGEALSLAGELWA